jgi:fibronectin-binding autotransporter adhesin
LNLTGNNTYTGSTTVNGGTLSVNGTLSGGGAVIAASGGTLGGTGMISGAVTISNGGTYAPGNGIGMQQVGSLSIGAGSILNFEFSTTPLTNDQVVVSSVNGLSVTGGGLNLYQEGGTTTYDARGTYQLLQFNGTIAGAATNLSVLNPVANRTYTLATVGNWVTLYIGGTLGWNPLNISTNSLWSNPQNWASGFVPVPYDELLFDGSTRIVNTNNLAVNTPYRGITFTNTAGAFVLRGNAIHLEGPVKNLSASTQTIALPMVLTDGDGVFVAQGGNLVVSGPISGSYGLLKSGAHALTLSGSNTYTGATLVNAGTLIVNGTISSTAGVTLAGGTGLGGHGTIAGLVSGSGTVSPGNSPGILTINQLNASANMNFNFEFTQLGSPTYSSPTASGNDVLRITNAAPFVVNLGLTNTVNLYVTAPLLVGQTNVLRGGFYTDRNLAFDGAITGAVFNLYINNQPHFTNLLYVTTVNDPAFSQNGWVMEFGVLGVETLTVIPEPSALLLMLGGAVTLYYSRRRAGRRGRS